MTNLGQPWADLWGPNGYYAIDSYACSVSDCTLCLHEESALRGMCWSGQCYATCLVTCLSRVLSCVTLTVECMRPAEGATVLSCDRDFVFNSDYDAGLHQ